MTYDIEVKAGISGGENFTYAIENFTYAIEHCEPFSRL